MTDPDTHEQLFVRSNTALWRRLFDGVVVLGPASDLPITITGPGLLIWQLLAEPTSAAAVAGAVAARFGVPGQVAQVDVEEIFRSLATIGAIAPSIL